MKKEVFVPEKISIAAGVYFESPAENFFRLPAEPLISQFVAGE